MSPLKAVNILKKLTLADIGLGISVEMRSSEKKKFS